MGDTITLMDRSLTQNAKTTIAYTGQSQIIKNISFVIIYFPDFLFMRKTTLTLILFFALWDQNMNMELEFLGVMLVAILDVRVKLFFKHNELITN